MDQVTKYAIRASFEHGQTLPVVDGFFHLTYVRNTGAAFGLMPGQRTLFIVMTLLVLVGIALYCWRARPRQTLLVSSLALIVGGALGNFTDRVLAGRVTDFFDFRVFPVFNIADTSLVLGAFGLFVWALFAPVEEPSRDGSKDRAR